MELTRETRRTRWLLLSGAWALMAGLVIAHTILVRDYVALLDSMGRREAAEVATPLRRPIPTLQADVQAWVRHALTLVETDTWRVRHTEIDNAPVGRDVHWNSAFAWMIVAHGGVRHLFTGEPMPLATERALAWFNPPLLLALMILFSVWTARRAGAAAGVFVALAIVCQPDLYAGFEPNYADHHGLLSVANFGIVLGALFMGAGWLRGSGEPSKLLPASREAARGAAIFSALSGAIGLWISAASVLPAIAFVGIAGLIATWWQGRAAKALGGEFDGSLWRLWGRTGATASFLFYLLEYAPSHLGWRLEVNHPLFALAWWGGSEIVATLCERRIAKKPAQSLWRLALPIAAIFAPLVIIAARGTSVFVVRDPFLNQLAARVVEGIALPQAIQKMGWFGVLGARLPWILAALLPAFALMIWGRRADRLVLGFATIACIAFLAMAFIQIRFLVNAGGALVCVLIVAMSALMQTWSSRARYAVVLGSAALLCLPTRINFLRGAEANVRERVVTKLDALQPLYRDIAAQLRADRREGDIVLLTNPDASTGIGYYGRLKTIGTLFWENVEGMRAAANMFAAKSAAEARALIETRRITHIALISESSFLRGFYELLNPGAKTDEWKSSFGMGLFARRDVPTWLEEIPYQPPRDLTIPDLTVVLYRTRFAAPPAERLLADARRHVQTRDFAAAERAIDQAMALDRSNGEIWVFKAELLLVRRAIEPALRAAETALAHTPAIHRASLGGQLGNAFHQNSAEGAAVALYRASLTAGYQPIVASNLAWLLATSRDAALRDGPTALELARRVAGENPNSYDFVSTFAAALAENGQFQEAANAATRAVELARALGNSVAVARAEARLRSYQAGQPWRQ